MKIIWLVKLKKKTLKRLRRWKLNLAFIERNMNTIIVDINERNYEKERIKFIVDPYN